MGNRRQAALTRSIQSALFRDADTFKKSVIGQMLAFFSIFYIRLLRHETNLFKHLRNETFKIDDLEYERSFQSSDRTQPPLQPMGDLGYSGSVGHLFPTYLPT